MIKGAKVTDQWTTLNLWLASGCGRIYCGNEDNPKIEFARSQLELRDSSEIEMIKGRKTG